MDGFLIAARAAQYAATISLAGLFAFLCLVADPEAAERLRRRLLPVAWSSLILALASGAAWLVLLAAEISGRPLGAVLSQGILATVLTRTRFGQVWLVRLALAGLLALCLAVPRRRRGRVWRWTGLACGAGMLATLAWAGHGGATPGRPGDLHLAADMLHLLAAGAWLGSLIPLALLLAESRRDGDPGSVGLARRAVLRFSVLAAASVAVLFTAGLVNTWFLAGSVPALIGTQYGRLLIAKIALFLTMVTIAAVNLLRMAPRLAPPPGMRPALLRAAIGHLRRNALLEAALGACVLAIVAILGVLPPALHTEPGWPLPFRLEPAALPILSQISLTGLGVVALGCAIAGVASAAAARYRTAIAAGAGLALCLALGGIVAWPALAPAYPTTFYAPAEPYAAASISRGAHLYAENCALCHGADGAGDGPAAAGLPVRPADLTAPHLFAHTAGDLFWWVGNGSGNGAMPGFAAVMNAGERWDVINFVRARAAGILARAIGPQISIGMALEVPDFAFESNIRQETLNRVLKTTPVLLVLFDGTPPRARLARLAAAQRQFAGAGLRVLAVDLTRSATPELVTPPSPLVGVSADVAASLALFRTPGDGGETDLLLDRAGAVRARWTLGGPGGLPDADALLTDAARVREFAAAPASHAGHGH